MSAKKMTWLQAEHRKAMFKRRSRRATHQLVILNLHTKGSNVVFDRFKKPTRSLNRVKSMLLKFTVVCMLLSTPGCATILGGAKTQHQVHKPQCGEPKRQVRIGYLVADILLCPVVGLIVDFATHKIYKPVPGNVVKECATIRKGGHR